MDRTKQLVLAVVVLAGLGGAVFYVAKEDAKKGSATLTAADLPDLKATDDIDKITITNADKGEVVLEKKGSGDTATWELTKPLSAAVNATNVKSLLENLKELKAKEVIVSAPTEDAKKDYQFEASKAVHVVTSKGGEKKLDATFGKAGARGQMAMVEGKPGIYAVSGYSSYLYAREVKGWRDTKILQFDDANVTSFAIENKNGLFSFTKGEKWAGTWKGKALEKLDEEKVKDGIRAFKFLSAEDFGDGKPASETGLDQPEGKVTITLKDGAGTYALKVGKTSSGSARYATKEGSETIYTIGQFVSDWALADAAKFQKKDEKADAGAGKGGAPSGADPHGHGGADDAH